MQKRTLLLLRLAQLANISHYFTEGLCMCFELGIFLSSLQVSLRSFGTRQCRDLR